MTVVRPELTPAGAPPLTDDAASSAPPADQQTDSDTAPRHEAILRQVLDYTRRKAGLIADEPVSDSTLRSYLRGDDALPHQELTQILNTTASANPHLSADGVSAQAVADAVNRDDMQQGAAITAGLRRQYDALVAHAQGAAAHGDYDAAVRLANEAHTKVPDGHSLNITRNPDGTISMTTGRQTHTLSPQQFEAYLIGPATSFDHVSDNGIEKTLEIASRASTSPAR